MTEKEFTREIYNITDCDKCPIAVFCEMSQTITCLQSARLYYRTHGKEFIQWQKIKENSRPHGITRISY